MATTTKIQATSRMSVKIRDNFYTIEFLEERTLDEGDDLNKEKELLFRSVNETVDDQVEEIVRSFK